MTPIEVVSTTETPKAPAPEASLAEGAEKKEEAANSAPAPKEEQEQKSTEESETSEEAEGSESESEDEEQIAAKEGTRKKKTGWQRRIDKLSSRLSMKDSEIEHWKSMALKGASGEKPKETQAQSARPKEEDFENHRDFEEALIDWKVDQKLSESKQEQRESEVRAQNIKTEKSHAERVKAFAAQHEDFFDVISEADEEVSVSPTVGAVILESEHGPALMYELAKNREELERISSLSPLAAARELGKIEDRIAKSLEKPKAETKTTKAPAPLKPVGSKGAPVAKSIYDTDLSQKEYEALMAKREKERSAS